MVTESSNNSVEYPVDLKDDKALAIREVSKQNRKAAQVDELGSGAIATDPKQISSRNTYRFKWEIVFSPIQLSSPVNGGQTPFFIPELTYLFFGRAQHFEV